MASIAYKPVIFPSNCSFSTKFLYVLKAFCALMYALKNGYIRMRAIKIVIFNQLRYQKVPELNVLFYILGLDNFKTSFMVLYIKSN